MNCVILHKVNTNSNENKTNLNQIPQLFNHSRHKLASTFGFGSTFNR